MKTNSELRRAAKTSLKGHWWPAIIPVLLYIPVAGAFASPSLIWPKEIWLLIGITVLEFLLLFPLSVGIFSAYHKFAAEGDDSILANILHLGYGNYLHNLLGYLAYTFIVCFFMLLLIVPGIIVALIYAMAPYILAEEPELSVFQAMKKSRIMMKGHKVDLFLIMLGYIGLALLSVVTLFIGMIWLAPYYYTVLGHFYESLRQSAAENLA